MKKKPDIRKLIGELAEQEHDLNRATFIAPCVPGGRVRAKVAGLVHTYRPRPVDYEGWGIFQRDSETVASLVEEAGLPLVTRYLEMLTQVRMRLVCLLRGRSWLAYPVNESDMRQKFGAARPAAVHLVSEGSLFEVAVCRSDGTAFWFEEIDRRADPTIAETLRDATRDVVDPAQLQSAGLAPEDRTAYQIAAQRNQAFSHLVEQRRERALHQSDEVRLRGALNLAGGDLREFHDRGDYWQVEWTTRDGERHTSAISKRDLTVISSGICLSDQDSDFDLQSLVGVIEKRDEW